MVKEIKYDIKYEHLKDDIVKDSTSNYHFNYIIENANRYKLELSDNDFIRFYKLERSNKDIERIMMNMSKYNKSLLDSLISYVTY